MPFQDLTTDVFIEFNTDEFGEMVSILIENETHKVFNNQFTLIQIPDEYYKVQIDNMVEIDIAEPITSAENYKVNYQHGIVYFDESLNGTFINITRYYGKGIILYSAKRIYTEIIDGEVTEVLEDILNNGKLAIEQINSVTDITADIIAGTALHNTLVTDIANATTKITEIETAITDIDDAVTTIQGAVQNGQNKIEEMNTLMDEVDATNSALKLFEEYNNSTTYVPLNRVYYEGSTYECKVQSIGNVPPTLTTSDTYWQMVAKNGYALTASELLTSIKTVDGIDSGLDADKFQGSVPSDFASATQGTKADSALPKAGGTMTGFITTHADPQNDMHVANKRYVDSIKMGLDYKDSVHLATTANIILSGLQTIDNVYTEINDRILVKNQDLPYENGLYLAQEGAWTRTLDADEATEVTGGMYVFVEEGLTNRGSGWVLISSNPITLGVTNLTFSQFAGGTGLSFGSGLKQTGSLVTLDTLGTEGTYTKVTVDSQGRVSVGANLSASDIPVLDWTKITTGKPTTLSGYGITDGTPSSHIGATGVAHGIATTLVNGFMSSTDKIKLDDLENYAHPLSHDGSTITLSTTNFNNNLDASITNVQLLADAVDDLIANGTTYTQTTIVDLINNNDASNGIFVNQGNIYLVAEQIVGTMLDTSLWLGGTVPDISFQLFKDYMQFYDSSISQAKMQIGIINVNSVNIPALILGAGDQNGNGRGIVYKDSNSLHMYYMNTLNQNVGIAFEESNITLSHDVVINGTIQATGTPTTLVSISKDLALEDKGTVQKCLSGSDITITVPSSATVDFPINTEIIFIRYGAGNVIFSKNVAVTLNSVGNKTKITNQYEVATLKKIASDEWLLFGSLSV